MHDPCLRVVPVNLRHAEINEAVMDILFSEENLGFLAELISARHVDRAGVHKGVDILFVAGGEVESEDFAHLLVVASESQRGEEQKNQDEEFHLNSARKPSPFRGWEELPLPPK